ncbi:MAG: MBOAT family protein [Bacteroidetes bacterium]|jgi:alginate O-acetyltransferase complex protein AlgI|nr:MBOAT family protein [Bacteroidota bacterium]
MLFNSLDFLMFFPIVFILFYALPHKLRMILLLAASYYFYMCWKAEYIILILVSTIIDYWAGLQMGKIPEKKKRRKYLYLSLIVNLGILFGFKYFNLFNDATRAVFESFDLFYGIGEFDALLPVGISFYTFQTLSYSIDIYNGSGQVERNPVRFGLYVAFFPQLVAGPIERSTRLLPQFYKKVKFERNRVVSGVKLMVWGFFKKVVIADTLSLYVGKVFMNPDSFEGWHIIVASILLHIQVYNDLSGYTDIARGAARVLGYDLMKNFNFPLFSRSFYDFWKRWHISLTTWFRDYLYIPLGGSRVVKWRWYYNIFIVFVISGLWHGANWTFVIWGVLHGLFQLIEIMTDKSRHKLFKRIGLSKIPGLQKVLGIITTLLLVSFATLFFGAANLNDSFILMGNAVRGLSFSAFWQDFLSDYNLQMSFILVAFLFIIEHMQANYNIIKVVAQKPIVIRWAVYVLLLVAIFNLGEFGEKEFIYFQF